MTSANGISSMERARVLPSPEELVAKCFELGLIMQRGGPEKSITHPAMTLQGTTIQKSVLDTLYQRQVLWNEAVDNTSRNFEFVAATLRQTAISDASFTGRFLEMLEKIYQQPPPAEFLAGRAWNEPMYQPTMLGIFRTDYMFDPTSPAAGSPDSPDLSARWKNVEINTISVSFAGLSPLVTQFHEYLHAYCQSSQAHGDATKSNLVHSSSGEDVPQSLAMAVTLWNDEVRSNLVCPGVNVAQLQPVVLTVVQEGERNTGDQYKLLFHLLQQHGVRSLRRTLTEVFSDMVLHPTTSASTGSPLPPLAVLDGRYAVAVVYFRSTYTPNDFPTEATWTARYRLECSNAIKCPSLPYHLLTWKKLQQRLADIDGVLAPVALGGDREKAASLGRHFMQLYSLNRAEYAIGGGSHDGDPETWIQAAIADPRRYVLKPQLEGGGNLIAGEAMRTLLRDTTMESNPTLFSRIRKEYILMEKIHYEVKSGAVLRAGEILSLDSNLCSELGIFGVVLSRGKGDVRMNRSAGYIVRSKPADVEDGGVMAGVACLDSLVLSD